MNPFRWFTSLTIRDRIGRFGTWTHKLLFLYFFCHLFDDVRSDKGLNILYILTVYPSPCREDLSKITNF